MRDHSDFGRCGSKGVNSSSRSQVTTARRPRRPASSYVKASSIKCIVGPGLPGSSRRQRSSLGERFGRYAQRCTYIVDGGRTRNVDLSPRHRRVSTGSRSARGWTGGALTLRTWCGIETRRNLAQASECVLGTDPLDRRSGGDRFPSDPRLWLAASGHGEDLPRAT
jgi:hypothetical protein